MDEKGLKEKDSKILLEKYGYNELKETHLLSPFKIFLHQIKGNFMIYLLVCAIALSFLVRKFITGYTILGVVILVIFIGFIQEYKAEKIVKSLRLMLMPVSIVIREGKEREILSREIVPGDILVLRSGEKIPADCFVIEEKDLMLDESILTGESREVKKSPAKDNKDFSEENLLFMGSFIINGKCTAKVIHTGMNTKFGQISKMISSAEKELPLQKKINKISKFMAIVAIIFSLLTGFFMIIGQPVSENLVIDALILVIALAVSAFPEGFPVVLITALSTGASRMAKKNAIVNRMSIIETLGETTVICSDKTGTITKGEMTVKKIFENNRMIDVSGIGYEGIGDFFYDEKKINPENEPALDLILKTSVICTDTKIQRTGEDKVYHIIGTPTEGALLVMASKAGFYAEDSEFTVVEEIPFSSERKMMSVLCKYKKEKHVFSKGASEYILEKSKYIMRDGNVYRLTERERERILEVNKKMTSEGFRVLGFAYKNVKEINKNDFEKDLIFLGFAGIEDPPRQEVEESIKICLNSGISVKMITGDNKETAIAIGMRIGLQGKILEGKEIDGMSEKDLSKIVMGISIFARVRPEHKLKIVKALKMNGEIVTMTGDGVNDAPALKEAHIGVAMGIGGTDVSREVSDLVLKDNNFTTIVSAIKEGRTIFKNIRKFVSYQLSCNYAELFIIFLGLLLSPLFGWPVPLLLALQILFMNLVTDDLPAITLSLNPSSKDVMEEKPRKNREILNKSLIIWILIAGFLMTVMTLGIFYFAFNVLNQSFESARTTALLALIFIEIGGAYNFRSFRKTVNLSSLKVNIYLLYASIISIFATLIIIYTPARNIFGTTPLPFIDWVVALLSALLFIIIFNVLKIINNKKQYFKLEHF